jgi:hypothetical protein
MGKADAVKYRLLIVDIDGTLVGRDGGISVENKEAVIKAGRSGVQVVLSTGRVPRACLGIVRELLLDGYHIFFDGALVSDPEQEHEIYVHPLKKEMVKQAVEFARQNEIYLELFSAIKYFVERKTRATRIHGELMGIETTMVDFNEVWKREAILKANLIVYSPEEATKAEKFRNHFRERLHFSVARSPAYPGVDFINVVDPQVSKGKALESLASHLGLPISETMAVGDGTNDISLLSTVGLAIAMDNAPDEVKRVADYITLDVDQNGLAAAIKKFLL